MFNKIKRRELETRALAMRSALDQIEGALMGFDDLHKQLENWKDAGVDVRVKLNIGVLQLRRIGVALDKCNFIINSEDYVPSVFGQKESST